MDVIQPYKHSNYNHHDRSTTWKPIICKFWLAGSCNRNPCKFLHPENTKPNLRRLVDENENGRGKTRKPQESICQQWINGNCSCGDNCRFPHSWFKGDCFRMLARLEGHKKGVTGIALPAGSDKLYSGGRDGTVRVWDCNSGQCTQVANQGFEIGCLICDGSWVFIGLPNLVKIWNVNDGKEFRLEGPVGQVYAMDTTLNDMLCVGSQDGSVLVWRYNSSVERKEDNPFEFVTSLKGHTKPVVCLRVGNGRLYSGSMDGTIKVWDIAELKCLYTLKGHTDTVTSVLCWDNYMLSASLDRTIRVWAASTSGDLEVVYTHREDEEIVSLFGMTGAEYKPVLYCSCNDNSVRLYELPSFSERGRIFAKKEVRAMNQGPGGLFFTSDATGVISVWNWLSTPSC